MSEPNATFDAIVVGSGISGGWAAKELTERGLKVLVLERGRDVEHGKDYVGEHKAPWEIPYGGLPLRELYAEEYPVQRQAPAFDETTRHFFNNDKQNPYDYDPRRPWLWHRADVLGGRSLLWSRQVYRWSDLDFEANKRDGHGIDWPIRYADIAPWYGHVERFIGVSGQPEGLAHVPDGEFLPPMEMNTVEKVAKAKIETTFPGRHMTIGRVAVLTRDHNGRAACHYCGPCQRGCSTGSYFSSQSSTLPAARATGNVTILTNVVVAGLDYDPATKRVNGVRVIDTGTKAGTTYRAKMVFLCASTIASTQILLNSKSESFPRGLANGSGALGHYLMDHCFGLSAFALFPGHEDAYYFGNRPNGVYIPRFRNVDAPHEGFLRGYCYQGAAMRVDWRHTQRITPGFGTALKDALREPGPWGMVLLGFAECLPNADNRMELHPSKVDRFGIPQVRFEFQYGANEMAMREDAANEAEKMLLAAGASEVFKMAYPRPGGGAIHEMGTARMGDDPAHSVLNRFNQTHEVQNLFVTDGSCMTSSSCLSPSITYMALTARASEYAAQQLRDGAV
jgi:choline dehydrogenase-like flavoprotein